LKIICRNCGAKFDVSEFEPFSRFECPGCGTHLRVPKRFDKYLLERICGKGGMSEVFKAIDPEFSRYVAIKIMNEEAAREPEVCGQFLNQAMLVSPVDHPGLIPIYDSGIVEGRPFLVMRYMDGGCLEQLVREKALPELPVLLDALSMVAGGLRAAHQGGIVHHDIKPGNIIMAKDGGAALGDFDLAESPEFPFQGTVREWASPAYVSPEWLATGVEDFRGDIFSLGVTAYELITGQIPYAADGDAEILLERRRHPLYLPAGDLNDLISPEFSGFLAQMMAFQPEERPGYSEIIEAFLHESRRISASGPTQTTIWKILGR